MSSTEKEIVHAVYEAKKLPDQFSELKGARGVTLVLLFDAAVRRFVGSLAEDALFAFDVTRMSKTTHKSSSSRSGMVYSYTIETRKGKTQIDAFHTNIDPGESAVWWRVSTISFLGDAQATRMFAQTFVGICKTANFGIMRRILEWED